MHQVTSQFEPFTKLSQSQAALLHRNRWKTSCPSTTPQQCQNLSDAALVVGRSPRWAPCGEPLLGCLYRNSCSALRFHSRWTKQGGARKMDHAKLQTKIFTFRLSSWTWLGLFTEEKERGIWLSRKFDLQWTERGSWSVFSINASFAKEPFLFQIFSSDDNLLSVELRGQERPVIWYHAKASHG